MKGTDAHGGRGYHVGDLPGGGLLFGPMTSSHIQEGTLQGRRVAITGRLSSMKREQALSFLGMVGAIFDRTASAETHYLVVGEAVSVLDDEGHPPAGLEAARELRATGSPIQIVSETEFLALLGLDELLRLFTSQQLGRILGVPRRELDSWVRRGLIRPVKIVNRLHYFDFGQVAGAKRLQDLLASGVPLARIRASLEDLECWLPGAGKSLLQLGILERHGRLVVRLPDGAIAETTGQLQIPFPGSGGSGETPNNRRPQAIDPNASDGSLSPAVGLGVSGHSRSVATTALPPADSEGPRGSYPADRSTARDLPKIVAFPGTRIETVAPGGEDSGRSPEAEGWFEQAIELEESGQLEAAAEAYQKALAVDGPAADLAFNLGNVLYSLARREEAMQRFLQAVEIDPGYIEAWNNLATAYFETDRPEEAVRALRKSLAIDPTYADAHYNLGEVLHFLGRDDEARAHWAAYLREDPSSDWAEHVRSRLRDLVR